MRLGYDRPSRLARFLFAALIALSWSGAAGVLAQAPAEAPAQAPASSEAEQLRQLADALEATAKVCAAVDTDLPRDQFDPKAVVARVGKEPVKLFAWVRDNTRYAPYRGALRGASGVLMDRTGNSLDRSLLLAALLQEAGVRVRLARGTFSAEQSEELLKAAWEDRTDPLPPPEPTDEQSAKTAEQAAARYGLDAARTRAVAAEKRLEGQKLREELVGGVVEQTERLTALVRPAPAAANDAARDAKERQRALDAVAEHTWVQYQDGGKWVDLDVLKPGTDAGAPLAKVARTVPLPATAEAAPPSGLDKSLVHEVELRVVIERCKGGKAETRVPLKHVLRPAELGHQPVTLALVALDSRLKLDVDKPDVGGQVRAALSKQTRWAPFLAAGNNVVAQKGFDDTGELISSPGQELGKTGETLAKRSGGATGLLNDLGGPAGGGAGRGAPGQGGAGVLTALWIEFEVRSPGAQPRVIRRDVMDVFGPARRAIGDVGGPRLDELARVRRAAALWHKIDLLPVGCMLPGGLSLHLELEPFIRNAPEIARALRAAAPAGGGAAAPVNPAFQQLMQVRPVPGPLLSLATARGGAGTLLGAGGAGAVVHRPNLFALHTGIAIGPDGTLAARRTLDIVANDVLVRPRAGRPGDGFIGGLRQGVLETHLERFALGARGAAGNTAELFAASPAQNIRWVAVRGHDDPALRELELGSDALTRVNADLRAGYIVVAPVAPVKSGDLDCAGWWRIDSATGNCVGMSSDGMGQAMTEHEIHDMWMFIAIGHWFYEAYNCFSDLGQQRGFKCAVCSFLVMWATESFASLVHGPAEVLQLTGLNATFATHGMGHMCHEWASGGHH